MISTFNLANPGQWSFLHLLLNQHRMGVPKYMYNTMENEEAFRTEFTKVGLLTQGDL